MTALERFLRYVTYDTQSSETSETTPSTPKQRLLGKALAQELQDLGLEGAHLAENGAVYAWLPAGAGKGPGAGSYRPYGHRPPGAQ